MTQLLISVRDAAEAQIALDGGADLIDVKEPARGSLGRADQQTLAAIARQVAGRRPLSAALGELLADDSRAALPAACVGAFRFAKFGLAGCARVDDWPARWRDAIERLPAEVAPVAVAYADWGSALAPEPRQVLEHAVAAGCKAVLVDTYDKSRGSLTSHLSLPELKSLVQAVQSRRMLCVLAGSLGMREIDELIPLAPNYVAVRRAACRDGRAGRLDAARVARLIALVRSRAPRCAVESGS